MVPRGTISAIVAIVTIIALVVITMSAVALFREVTPTPPVPTPTATPTSLHVSPPSESDHATG